MKRYEERKQELLNATERLKEALQETENDIIIDGTLHRFEFTFELAWKTMKDYLEYSGIIEGIGSPREIIKTAFANGIIEDGEKWINMMLARNSLSHLYDEEKSRKTDHFSECRTGRIGAEARDLQQPLPRRHAQYAGHADHGRCACSAGGHAVAAGAQDLRHLHDADCQRGRDRGVAQERGVRAGRYRCILL